ncbi:DUF6541 family protein [Lentzea sp. JNUCC 0626]|uniref:DUF6541 family protein n=1 Tax=Lentzea sp. JNUCC 0626 TaxID=3367513 RepID=UPI00374A7F88
MAALAVAWLPGLGLLTAFGVRRPLWLAGFSAVTSVGIAALVGMACGVLGISYGVVPLAALTALLLLIGGFRWWRAREAGPRRPRWDVLTRVAGVLVLLTAVGIGLRTWLSGLAGSFATLPQEHDPIVHTELVSYIMRTGHGAAWQLLPIDFLSGSPVSPYPSGMHLLSAAAGELAGGPIRGFNGITVALLVVGLALSTSALAYVAARRARVRGPLAFLAGGIAALVAVGMNAPTITMAAQGGVLPNAAAMVLAPGFIAAVLSVRPRQWSAAPVLAVGAVGLLALHPSGGVTVGVSVVVWWLGDLLNRGGWARLKSQLPPLLLTGVVAAVVAAPLLVTLLAQAGRTTAFPPDVAAVPFVTALGRSAGLGFTGYLFEYGDAVQLAAFVLVVLGGLVLLVTRRALGLLLAAGAWVAITTAMWVSPGTGFEAIVTGFFYNSMLRVRSHFYLFVPVVVAVGAVLLAVLVAAFVRRRVRRVAVPAIALAAALAVLFAAAYALVPARGYMNINAHYLASRYGNPTLHRVGPDDEAAFDFLAGKVGPGERVMNSANDGSTYLYVEKGIPVVNTIAMGFTQAPYTYELLQRFNRYETDAKIREEILKLGVTWVVVDTDAPLIGAAGSPDNWAGTGLFSFAPGLADLDGLPGLTERFRSGTVRVYQLDTAVLEGMPTGR